MVRDVMNEHSGDLRRDLLNRIDSRRSSIELYLQKARPRGGRLSTVAIVSSAIAAVLTAGPALGGEPFTESVASGLSLPSDSLVWRCLCFLALAVSVVAAIATNLARSQDIERKIAAAELANAELEGLRTLVEFDQVEVGDAVKQYRQSVAKIPWVEEHQPVSALEPAPAPSAVAYRAGRPQAPPRGWGPPGQPIPGANPTDRGRHP
jgi:hypothetical protein